MRARDFHVFTVLGYGTAGYLNALRLQNARDLFIGQRLGWIFVFDQLFYATFENQKRCIPAFRSIDALAEEISQLEHALGRVRVLVGNRAADGRRMHADLLGNFLDHHRLQFVNSPIQEVALAGHDGVADFQDRLLPLLDVLNQLDGALETLFHIIAGIAIVAIFRQQLAIRRVQTQRWDVVVIHHHKPLIAVLHESDIRLNQASLRLVVLKARPRVEGADVIKSNLNRFYRTVNGPRDFLVLLVLQRTEMLVH